MRWAGSLPGGSAGRRGSGLPLVGTLLQALAFAALTGGFLWLVQLYASGLRDPRYLDGWVLAGGMALQVAFHVAIKSVGLSPRSARRWRGFHIFVGYLLIGAFLSHSDFSLPDTAFEWALWGGFVLVTLSGILGTYLGWSMKAKGRIAEGTSLDRIPALRAALAQEVRAIVAEGNAEASLLPLPDLPHDDWIKDLYSAHLRDFFRGPRNFGSHLVGSQRPLRRLTDEIDGLSRYVDAQGREKLAAIRDLVIEKDRLDFARVYLGLGKAWQLVHVPITYALVVLTVAHVLIAYSFSSGDW